MIVLDRSRMVARQECPRLRWLNYHHLRTGIEKVQMSLPLATGITVHEALAEVLRGVVPEEASAKALEKYEQDVRSRGLQGIEHSEEFIAEQKRLVEGMVLGWALERMPLLLAEYDIESVEQEDQWELAPGMTQMLRCDGLLRRRADGERFILEFKTVSVPSYDWQQQWEHNIQLMSYTLAIEELKGSCGGVVIEGLVKGYRKLETAASSPYVGQMIQSSPFCYAQKNQRTEELSFEYQRGKDWQKVRSSESGLSTSDWVAEMQERGVLQEQYVSLPPICPLKEHMDRWRRQAVAAETRFAMAVEQVRDLENQIDHIESHGADAKHLRDEHAQLLDFHFPQHDNHCRRFRSACSMMQVCFNPEVEKDPIGSGLYQQRTPHHHGERTDDDAAG